MFQELESVLDQAGLQVSKEETKTEPIKDTPPPNWITVPISAWDVADAAKHNTDVRVFRVAKPGSQLLCKWGWYPLDRNLWAMRCSVNEAACSIADAGYTGSIYLVSNITPCLCTQVWSIGR
jgi:hypothetical protein